MSLLGESKRYWGKHPIGAEVFDSEIGSREFYDKYLEYYDQFYDYKVPTFRYEQYRGKKVLEIGCGLGIDTIKFARWGAEVTAVDLSETSVECTRLLFGYYGLKGDIRLGDAQELAFDAASFDVVYAYGVLMHVEDTAAAIDEMHRVLKPGGEALVVLYHCWLWYWLLVNVSGTNVESADGDPALIDVYSKRQARCMFERFSSVAIESERLPKETVRRRGLLAACCNYGFVKLFRCLPKKVANKIGWHLIVKAAK